jgi:hypothetical protein
MKELIEKYKLREVKDLFNLSFQIESVFNKYLESIAESYKVSKSFLIRISIYKFIELYLDNIETMEQLICPICGSTKLEKTNVGTGNAKGTSIYLCDNGDVFVSKDLAEFRKIDEFLKKEKISE